MSSVSSKPAIVVSEHFFGCLSKLLNYSFKCKAFSNIYETGFLRYILYDNEDRFGVSHVATACFRKWVKHTY